MRLPASIMGTASVKGRRAVETDDLIAQVRHPTDPVKLKAKMGITRRHWLAADVRPSVLAAEAVRRALDQAGIAGDDLSRLLFVTSGGGEFLTPATANAVIDALGLNGRVDGFDINNACTGFLSALDVAARSVATGMGPVAIAVVETMSWFIEPDDPRPYLVLGDGIAAAIVGPSNGSGGLRASVLANEGHLRAWVGMEHPSRAGRPTTMRFGQTNADISRVALDALEGSARRAVDQAGMAMEEIDWFVPHQPNGSILARIVERLSIPDDRMVNVVDEVGSIVAASIPVSLDKLLRTKPVQPGDTLLMATVGGGMSHGAIVYELPS
jgi:3-oxoacyl-[acyl-carrier-protein] synthase III